eukprot:188817-Rhodomonas_salina.2
MKSSRVKCSARAEFGIQYSCFSTSYTTPSSSSTPSGGLMKMREGFPSGRYCHWLWIKAWVMSKEWMVRRPPAASAMTMRPAVARGTGAKALRFESINCGEIVSVGCTSKDTAQRGCGVHHSPHIRPVADCCSKGLGSSTQADITKGLREAEVDVKEGAQVPFASGHWKLQLCGLAKSRWVQDFSVKISEFFLAVGQNRKHCALLILASVWVDPPGRRQFKDDLVLHHCSSQLHVGELLDGDVLQQYSTWSVHLVTARPRGDR